MSTNAYWVDDDRWDTMQRMTAVLNERLDKLVRWETFSEAVNGIAEILYEPGPIIVDLRLPWEDHDELRELDGGLAVGAKLIKVLQSELGATWPIFILSANTSSRVVGTIAISAERVFSKPLVANADVFVDAIVGEAQRLSGMAE